MDCILDIGNKITLKILAPLAASIYYKGTLTLYQAFMGW